MQWRGHRTLTSNESERRKSVIRAGRTDITRWADLSQLEAAWEGRARFAADFIAAGTRVPDIGCGSMKLEQCLPFGCSYVPSDVIRRVLREAARPDRGDI